MQCVGVKIGLCLFLISIMDTPKSLLFCQPLFIYYLYLLSLLVFISKITYLGSLKIQKQLQMFLKNNLEFVHFEAPFKKYLKETVSASRFFCALMSSIEWKLYLAIPCYEIVSCAFKWENGDIYRQSPIS